MPTNPASWGLWYAVRVRSRCESRVQTALLNDGLEEFLPTWTETVRWSDRKKRVVRPLFPGYVFARFDRKSEGVQILSITGVIQILGHDESGAISAGEIDNLRLACEATTDLKTCPYVAGSSVRVVEGPFAGVTGVITRVRGGTILSIPVEILCRSVLVHLSSDDVELA